MSYGGLAQAMSAVEAFDDDELRKAGWKRTWKRMTPTDDSAPPPRRPSPVCTHGCHGAPASVPASVPASATLAAAFAVGWTCGYFVR